MSAGNTSSSVQCVAGDAKMTSDCEGPFAAIAAAMQFGTVCMAFMRVPNCGTVLEWNGALSDKGKHFPMHWFDQ